MRMHLPDVPEIDSQILAGEPVARKCNASLLVSNELIKDAEIIMAFVDSIGKSFEAK